MTPPTALNTVSPDAGTQPALPGRQRAHEAHEKAARRASILDAAERLYSRTQDLPNVADVASEAKLAKGTMYLYFQTKEAIYLGLHERHCKQFFDALNTQLESDHGFGCDEMVALIDKHMLVAKSYLPLSHVCMALARDRVDEASHEAFHTAMAGWLLQAGAGIERRMPALKQGDGVRFLQNGYAMVLGLHQLLGQTAVCEVHTRMHGLMQARGVAAPMAPPDFRAEAHAALRAMWLCVEQHGLAEASALA
jgi:AcrR family transcriptional regulator